MRLNLILLFAICLSGCRAPEIKDKSISPDTKSELSKGAVFPIKYKFLNSATFPELTLDSLKDGYDSLQVRIWIMNGLYGYTELYILKSKVNGWNGLYVELTLEGKFANGDSTQLYLQGPFPFEIKKVRALLPKSGWKKFISKLDLDTLRFLPDMTDLKLEDRGQTDGTIVYLEYAASRYYHCCEYLGMERYVDISPEAKYVSKLVSILTSAAHF